jgi:hypothetical protein
MGMTQLPDAITEAEALRSLNWPDSRRAELRTLLPSVPAGRSLIYQKSAVETLSGMSLQERATLRETGTAHLHTR